MHQFQFAFFNYYVIVMDQNSFCELKIKIRRYIFAISATTLHFCLSKTKINSDSVSVFSWLNDFSHAI